ncbi:MAG: hypothetical protein OXC91_11555, partial [Rhodobacteraceae bacterium]|nr:hypothetical protein [Paracoccaceae bacterium]
PVPFEITLPTADVKENPVSTERVYVSADGRIGYDGNIGDPAWSSLLEDGAVDRIAVHVDASVPGVELARIVKRLSEIGIGTVDLVTR